MSILEKWVLDTLDLNDDTVFTLEEADAPPPPELEEWVKGADSNGAILAREPLCDNRIHTYAIRINPQATMDLALAKIGLLVDKLKESQRNANGLPLVWTPADSTLSITFRCLSGQITGLPTNITSGWLVKAPLIQVKLTCLPFGEGTEVTSYINEVTNPSFESAITPWTSGLLHTNAATSLTVSSANGAQAGTNAALVNCTTTANSGIEQAISGGFPPGSYTFAFYARSVTGTLACESVLTGSSGGGGVQAAALTTTWTRFTHTVTLTIAATTLNIAVRTTATSGNDFVLDACLVVRGASAPSYFDGATGTGYVWLGTAHASKSAGPNAAVSTDPIVTLEMTGVPGDVPATGKLTITDGAAQSRRYMAWGLESRWYPTASPPSLLIDSTSMVTSGFAGTTGTRSGAYSGASNNVITAILQTQPQAICGLGNLSHVGTFRPQLRINVSAVTCAVRLTYQALDGPYRSLSYYVPVSVGFNHLDLGAITIPETTLGTQRWTGRIEAYSTATGGETFELDVLELMPAEQFGRARASYAYAPGILVGRDQFTGITAGTALNGRVAPSGGTWTTSGSATDIGANDAPLPTDETMARATVSDGGFPVNCRHARLGATNYTDIEVGVDVYATVPSAGLVQGAVARWVDASNFLFFGIQGGIAGGIPVLQVMVAGTVVAAKYPPGLPLLPVNVWYRLMVVAFASGRAIATMTNTDGAILYNLTLTNSALATGGTLATGRPGFVDNNSTATASTRYYDNFYAATPAAEPVVCYSGQSLQVSSVSTLREDSTGVYAGAPPYVGGRFFLPNAGGPGRKTRIAAFARRNDILAGADDQIADSTIVQASYTSRYLVVPR